MSTPAEHESPPTKVIALRYAAESGDAPRVVAKGRGAIAAAILAHARAHGVPIREDPDLLEMLGACRLGEEIPTELYDAVARLLAYLYRLNGESKGPLGERGP